MISKRRNSYQIQFLTTKIDARRIPRQKLEKIKTKTKQKQKQNKTKQKKDKQNKPNTQNKKKKKNEKRKKVAGLGIESIG